MIFNAETSLKLKSLSHTGTIIRQSYLSTVAPGLQLLKETVQNSLKLINRKENSGREKTLVLVGESLSAPNGIKVGDNLFFLFLT